MRRVEIPIDQLRLDPHNPRLPEELQGADQVSILQYLEAEDVLSELAASFVANGFFPTEPLLVRGEISGEHTVVEGNRRLATLKILLGDADASSAGLHFELNPAPSPAALRKLRVVPCLETDPGQDLTAFLGYRHISGLRPWNAEAKARYIAKEVERSSQAGNQDPFYEVGRLLGSNALGIRNAYVAYTILREAKSTYGIDTRYVLQERFSVWGRLLGTHQVPTHIGYAPADRTYASIRSGLNGLDAVGLREVVGDLTPQEGSLPVLRDSRDSSTYSEVLSNDRALEVLRQYHDLDLAKQVVESASLSSRIEKLARSCEILMQDARALGITLSAVQSAERLLEAADSLDAVLRRGYERMQREKTPE